VFSELTLELTEKNYIPDLCIYPVGALNEWEDEIQVTMIPLCVVEILSPTQSLQELLDKAKIYFENGVKSYWLVIPSLKNIYVFDQLQQHKIFQQEDLLEDSILDVQIDLKKVFL
jgi:Uma2 family endonuclease